MMKRSTMILAIALMATQAGSVFGIDFGKLTSSALSFGSSAVPDVLGLGVDISKFIPEAKKIKIELDQKLKDRRSIKVADKEAREANLMSINLDVINLTVLLTGMTAKFLRIVSKATPMLDALVDPVKDPKATKAIGQFKEVFSAITDIMSRINDVNGVMYDKMVGDLKTLSAKLTVQAQETGDAKALAEAKKIAEEAAEAKDEKVKKPSDLDLVI